MYKILSKYCRMINIIQKREIESGSNVLRSYPAECTGSRPISEVNQLRAILVLGWETSWEPLVANILIFFL
ncbi:Hypothetical protein SRAE_2000173800 [Strongyloides ratti]|uniref:Uncharacterized protein n=1 Tax=Strongyloides ratti TaxID=34506 RepID=A0A090LFZ6_STRRB|nr:Hypothetical protein SRAE_2000173800 [Strongyloides ratti]CEF67073.1 Hypothetical protein SRAE_2000173800 [Strongyloides ratti]